MNDKSKFIPRNLDITDEMIERFAKEINDNIYLRIIIDVGLEREVIQAVINSILSD
jgi:hypothetical protein